MFKSLIGILIVFPITLEIAYHIQDFVQNHTSVKREEDLSSEEWKWPEPGMRE